MPIRMERDEDNSSQDNFGNRGNRGGGRGGRGGIGGNIIGMLLPFLFRNPKVLLIVVVIGVALYFFGGKIPGLSNNSAISEEQNSDLFRGCSMNQDTFAKAEIYAELDPSRHELPSSFSLESFCPRRGNQGSQGSCVGWSSAYAARTILEAQASGKDPNSIIFSPSFLYNQINLPNCEGSYIHDAMAVLQQRGCLPLSDYAYDPGTCENDPNNSEIEAASPYRIRGFQRLTNNGSNLSGDDRYSLSLDAIKQNLAQGGPVVIGMAVGGSFMSDMESRDTWRPDQNDYNNIESYGGHALCVVGYDDKRDGGSFRIMNSWGEKWGDRGMFWISYRDFQNFTREAYGMYPLASKSAKDVNKLQVKVGMVNNQTQEYISLNQLQGATFSTGQVRKGTKFKMEVSNSTECYVYVFGLETDGSSYVLFPYTEKHSPFCGITGTRTFPRDYSMKVDDIGNKDYMAVVVSKKQLDYKTLNESINRSRSGSYEDRIKTALGSDLLNEVNYTEGNTVGLQSSQAKEKAAVIVVEVNK